MPIDKQEFENGTLRSNLEKEIITFLKERRNRAYTSQEIMDGTTYHTEFNTPEITKMSTFAVSDFTVLLHSLAKKETIKLKVVRGRMYFMAGLDAAKCPKCHLEILEPKKTWKMAGRPDKKGERLQLHIGLFECSTHGFFRAVLDKQKIPATSSKKSIRIRSQKKGTKRGKRRKSTGKRPKKRKTTRKRAPKRTREKGKKPKTWSLI